MGRKEAKPEHQPRKGDNSRNPEGTDELIARQLRKERNLYPLRINDNTYIYVPKRKQTPEYAAKWRERMKQKE